MVNSLADPEAVGFAYAYRGAEEKYQVVFFLELWNNTKLMAVDFHLILWEKKKRKEIAKPKPVSLKNGIEE